MKIKQILNNNIVVALDHSGDEVIVMSKGLGFRKKRGDLFPLEEAQKIFVLQDEETRSEYGELMQDMDPDSIEIAEGIISEASEKCQMKLADVIHISLTDHINGTLTRLMEGINLTNQLTLEISRLYPEEFAVGLKGIRMIAEKTGLEPIQDEAAFIALHLVNCQTDETLDEKTLRKTLVFIGDVVKMVEQAFHMKVDESSHSYYRFATHLKFLCRRIMNGQTFGDDDVLYGIVRQSYPDTVDCVDKIAHVIQMKYKRQISAEEKAYLMIYVERLRRDSGEN